MSASLALILYVIIRQHFRVFDAFVAACVFSNGCWSQDSEIRLRFDWQIPECSQSWWLLFCSVFSFNVTLCTARLQTNTNALEIASVCAGWIDAHCVCFCVVRNNHLTGCWTIVICCRDTDSWSSCSGGFEARGFLHHLSLSFCMCVFTLSYFIFCSQNIFT